jgi:integrase/recombinase XerD
MAKEYLDPAEVARLEDAAKTPRDRLLIRLLFRLGCRVSEALAITLDDIDFSARRVTIVHLKARVWVTCQQCAAKLGLRHDYCPKCGARCEMKSVERAERRRQRSLPVDSGTLNLIRDFIQVSGRPVGEKGNKYLFGVNRHRAWQIVRQCAQKAGLGELRNPETGKTRGISPHRLRDAFAVHAMKTDDSGEGMRLLQEHLGHSSFDTTAKYRKVAGEEHQAWYEKLWGNKDGD